MPQYSFNVLHRKIEKKNKEESDSMKKTYTIKEEINYMHKVSNLHNILISYK